MTLSTAAILLCFAALAAGLAFDWQTHTEPVSPWRKSRSWLFAAGIVAAAIVLLWLWFDLVAAAAFASVVAVGICLFGILRSLAERRRERKMRTSPTN